MTQRPYANFFHISLFSLFTALIISVVSPGAGGATKEYIVLSCAVHIHSTFSGKEFSLERIVKDARAANIDSLIFTDHDIMRWEYGIWPLTSLLKRTIERPSVISAGPERYLGEIKNLQEKNPDIILIPGVESTAFYYWTGSPFDKSLVLNSWHKHILVLGMPEPEQYRLLPVVSNSHAKNNPFDQYHGDQGDKPYQALIDYANANDALTYWAHPEAPNWEKPIQIGPIKIETKQYASSLMHTKEYTGFAIFAEGMRKAGQPGNEWDKTLQEYCRGARTQPVFVIGELDYGEDKSYRLDEITNMIYVKDRSAKDIIASLKGGKNYVRWAPHGAKWNLDMPSFFTQSGEIKALCGETIHAAGRPKIFITLSASDFKQHPVTIRIVRNGKLYTTLEGSAPNTIIYEDPASLDQKLSYYRVLIDDPAGNRIATNPVFISKN